MYRLMMAPLAETCSDAVRQINSVMRSRMRVSYLVFVYQPHTKFYRIFFSQG
jgi:hypothetical protein